MTAGTYSLDPTEVRKVIDLILAGKPYDKEQFRFYHYYRNHFNVKDEVTTLKKIKGRQYVDNNGNLWEKQLGGEHEMVIRYDGKRIDALTCEKYQETYNFGRTRNAFVHKRLDMDPHDKDTVYLVRQDTGHVSFID